MRTQIELYTRTPARRQRGIVLFVSLIVMVLMSLAAIALIRAVDTTNLAIGNLAFRQASILPANYAVEAAAAALFSDANKGGAKTIADLTQDDPNQNYYATHDPVVNGDNKYGIPLTLQKKSTAAALKVRFKDGADNTITYVIERMCNPNAPTIPADKSAKGTWCDMMSPKQSAGTTVNDPPLFPFPSIPYYRVTVRVDGPQNTASFVQAMLR